MHKSIFAAGAAVMAAAFSLPSALQAHDSSKQRDGGGHMMDSDMGHMGRMMDHCSQMLQGASTRPNEQWREETPPANHQNDEKQ